MNRFCGACSIMYRSAQRPLGLHGDIAMQRLVIIYSRQWAEQSVQCTHKNVLVQVLGAAHTAGF